MNLDQLTSNIIQTHQYFEQGAAKAVNTGMTVRNWIVGAYIVEYEQKGDDRAKYGEKLIRNLEALFAERKIKGFSATYLKVYRQFYLTYIHLGPTVKGFSEQFRIGQTASDLFESMVKSLPESNVILPIEDSIAFEELLTKLSFSHIVELLKIEATNQREYYQTMAIRDTWSVKQMKRQIATLDYERFALSKAPQRQIEANPRPKASDLIKSSLIFEFLDLPMKDVIEESDVEQALINNLQEFLLELGNGFCFEARQKRILIGDEHFFVDLVFYHRILKCHILIELKIDNFSHAHIGQLNTYVNYYNDHKPDEDNPPIGILLCTGKNDALVKYALGGMNQNLFVSEYLIQLPATEELQNMIQAKLRDHLSN
jgi:predicted nuclease of restriction endonuclease-like (RecB) superfamily